MKIKFKPFQNKRGVAPTKRKSFKLSKSWKRRTSPPKEEPLSDFQRYKKEIQYQQQLRRISASSSSSETYSETSSVRSSIEKYSKAPEIKSNYSFIIAFIALLVLQAIVTRHLPQAG